MKSNPEIEKAEINEKEERISRKMPVEKNENQIYPNERSASMFICLNPIISSLSMLQFTSM